MEIEEIIIFFLMFIIVMIISTSLITCSDNIDIDDELGPYLCQQHGHEFKGYDYKYSQNIENMELKIYCQEKRETKISDGYLVLG